VRNLRLTSVRVGVGASGATDARTQPRRQRRAGRSTQSIQRLQRFVAAVLCRPRSCRRICSFGACRLRQRDQLIAARQPIRRRDVLRRHAAADGLTSQSPLTEPVPRGPVEDGRPPGRHIGGTEPRPHVVAVPIPPGDSARAENARNTAGPDCASGSRPRPTRSRGARMHAELPMATAGQWADRSTETAPTTTEPSWPGAENAGKRPLSRGRLQRRRRITKFPELCPDLSPARAF
jgi:hypothetical protein